MYSCWNACINLTLWLRSVCLMTSQQNQKGKQWLGIKRPVVLARHKIASNLVSRLCLDR